MESGPFSFHNHWYVQRGEERGTLQNIYIHCADGSLKRGDHQTGGGRGEEGDTTLINTTGIL